MKTPLSHIANLRCPGCGALQPMYAAWLTLEARPFRRPLYPRLRCGSCRAQWRCRPRRSGLGFLGQQVALVLVLVAVLPWLIATWLPLIVIVVLLIGPLFARFTLTLEAA